MVDRSIDDYAIEDFGPWANTVRHVNCVGAIDLRTNGISPVVFDSDRKFFAVFLAQKARLTIEPYSNEPLSQIGATSPIAATKNLHCGMRSLESEAATFAGDAIILSAKWSSTAHLFQQARNKAFSVIRL